MKPQERHAAIFGSGLTYTQKIVLLAMCSFMSDGRDTAWPSVGTLQTMTSLGERAVQKVLKAGCSAGWLKEDLEAGRRTRTFYVVWSELPEPTPARRAPSPHEVHPAPDAPPHDVHPARGAGTPARGAPYPAPHSPNPARGAPEPDRTDQEPTKEPTTNVGLAADPAVGSSVERPDDAPESPPEPPPPDPPPKPPSDSERGLEMLRTLRSDLHERAMGKKPRGTAWAKGKSRAAMLKKVKRFLGEVKAEELGKPLSALQALARWAYLAPGAGWLRDRGGEPLDLMLGGPAGDPSSRMRRAREALDWHEGGESDRPASGRSSSSGGFFAGLDFGLDTEPEEPPRKVLNPEVEPPEAPPSPDFYPFEHPV